MFIEAKDDGGDGDNWSYKSCKGGGKGKGKGAPCIHLK